MKITNIVKKGLILFSEIQGLSSKIEAFRCIIAKSNLLSHEVMVKNKDGKFYCGNNINAIFIASSLHESKISEYISTLKEGVFIDIGANIGKYTVKVGKQNSDNVKVVAIEPMKENQKMLQKNIELNNLHNVVVINKACGASKGKLILNIDQYSPGGHSIIKRDISKGTIEVEVTTLNSIVSELGLKRIDLIKIDVEGAEEAVLKGGIEIIKKTKPKIIAEAWNNKYLEKIVSLLLPLGYIHSEIERENYLFELPS